MTTSYSIEQKILSFVFTGRHDLREDMEALSDALDEPNFVDGSDLLLEVTPSAEPWTSDEVLTWADYLVACKGRIGERCAIVVSNTLHYGLARMISAYADGSGVAVRVFRERATAMRWLSHGVDAAEHETRSRMHSTTDDRVQ